MAANPTRAVLVFVVPLREGPLWMKLLALVFEREDELVVRCPIAMFALVVIFPAWVVFPNPFSDTVSYGHGTDPSGTSHTLHWSPVM